jgi:hypothetical protein
MYAERKKAIETIDEKAEWCFSVTVAASTGSRRTRANLLRFLGCRLGRLLLRLLLLV